MALSAFTRAMLEQAVRLYLEEAYRGARVPDKVLARLAWPAAADTLEQLACAEVFDPPSPPAGRRAGPMAGDVPPAECDRLRLRLGNPRYPHMKLGVDRVPDSGDWVLVVDCHDRQWMAAVQEDERAALEALIRSNNELKARIERRWAEAGLPTFEQYIRSRLPARP